MNLQTLILNAIMSALITLSIMYFWQYADKTIDNSSTIIFCNSLSSLDQL